MDELIEKISKGSGVKAEEIEKRIQEKQDELSGLVSREGAAYIVGRELGVNLIKEGKRELKIKNLVAGLNAVDIKLDILKIFEKRDYEKNGKKGSVLNILVGDETGKTRLVLWGDDTNRVEESGLTEGDIVKVNRATVKKNNFGEVELGLGKGGNIEKTGRSEGFKKTVKRGLDLHTRVDIADINDGYFEIRGCIVQIFKRSPFFFVCPKCDGKLEGKICGKDGEVEPKKQLIISAVADDGTGTIRVVFFREMAQKLIGKVESENAEDIYSQIELGREYVIKGKVKKSDYTKELEMVANFVDDVDPKKEAEKILAELEAAG